MSEMFRLCCSAGILTQAAFHCTPQLCASGSVQVICKLLKLGADPLAKDAAGQTPADLARATDQTLIAQLLDRAAQDTQQQQAAATVG